MLGNRDQLSDREREILNLVATGASNKEIARALNISTNTIKVHLRNIFAKIGVSSRTEAAMYAINSGILTGYEISTVLVENESKQVGVNEDDNRFLFRAFFLIGLLVVFTIILIVIWRLAFGNRDGQKNVLESEKWIKLTPMITPRSRMGTTVFENQIYAIAGMTKEGVSSITERYNPETNSWEEVQTKLTAVMDMGAVLIGGKIFVPGGVLSSGEISNLLEVYDVRNGVWSQAAKIPHPISAYGIATLDGKIYLFGGWDGKKYLSSVLEYRPDEDKWYEKTPMKSPRAYPGAAAIGGSIYVIGGYDGKSVLDINESYTPSLDLSRKVPWEINTPIPGGRYKMGIVSGGDAIYILGGISDNEDILPPIAFFPQIGAWQEFGESPIKDWSSMGLSFIGTKIYSIGGEIDTTPIAENLAYQVLFLTVFPILP